MSVKPNIAGYCRISVDEELDRDNTSIENQKAIITDFVSRKFPDSCLDFYEDRDRSGYTFEQREGYQRLRKKMIQLEYDILIVKDFSRFSRRNSKGLVELEDLRDAGMRIISIGDNIDYHKRNARNRHLQKGQVGYQTPSGGGQMDMRRPLRLCYDKPQNNAV